MSNLTNNTAELRDILAAVNALPKASGGGGITPSGTLTIRENGKKDVTNYAEVDVQVPSEEPNIQPLSVTKNGTYTPSGNVDGYGPVTVNVQTALKLQEKSGTNSITPTKSQQTITPDSGYDGLSKVVVNKIPDTYIIPSGTKEITANGNNIDVANYAKVNVNVPISGGGGGDGDVTDLQYCVLSNFYFEDAGLPAPMVIYFRPGWTWNDFVASPLNKYIPGQVKQDSGGYRYVPYSAEPQPVAFLTTKSGEVRFAGDDSYFLITDWMEFTFTLQTDAMIPGHTYHWD